MKFLSLSIDATTKHENDGFSRMTFLGYNQIKMNSTDEEQTSFITTWGTYCYKFVPFGLKNVGATYQ